MKTYEYIGKVDINMYIFSYLTLTHCKFSVKKKILLRKHLFVLNLHTTEYFRICSILL